jgi:hypothetical protein
MRPASHGPRSSRALYLTLWALLALAQHALGAATSATAAHHSKWPTLQPLQRFPKGGHVDASDPSLSMSPRASDLVLLFVDKTSVAQCKTWREVFGGNAHFILIVYDDLDVNTLPDVDSTFLLRARGQVR